LKIDHSLLRFAIVGVLATGIHVVLVSVLIPFLHVDVGISNGIAFILATLSSNYLNTKWSFGAQFNKRTVVRFWIVAVAGGLTAIYLARLAENAGLHYLAGVTLIVFTLPVLTYLAHRFWTYTQ